MTLNHKIIFTIVTIALLFSNIQSQDISENSLIVLTAQNHQAILSSQQLIQLSQKLENVKAFSIDTDNSNSVLKQLKNIAKNLNISKNQISSLVPSNINKEKIEQSINFEKAQNLKQIFNNLAENSNIILSLNSINSRRVLEQQSEDLLISQNNGFQSSQMFINMSPSTLSGLLVSLFLIVMLVIAIGCLYQVKTNDKFGKNNLWVGKQN